MNLRSFTIVPPISLSSLSHWYWSHPLGMEKSKYLQLVSPQLALLPSHTCYSHLEDETRRIYILMIWSTLLRGVQQNWKPHNQIEFPDFHFSSTLSLFSFQFSLSLICCSTSVSNLTAVRMSLLHWDLVLAILDESLSLLST